MGNLSEIQGIEIQPSSFQGGCLPKGSYLCELKNSEVKEAKSGGKYLKLDFVVCDGSEYDNYHIFENLNIINANEKAQQIALGMLSQLSKACGKQEIPDESYELHDIKVMVQVKVEKSTNPAYPDDKNRVVAFHPYTMKSIVHGSNKQVPVVKGATKTQAQVTEEVFSSDDIPF